VLWTKSGYLPDTGAATFEGVTEVDPAIAVELSDDEWKLLWKGVLELGGPSRVDDVIARAIGYRDRADLFAHQRSLLDALKQHEPLTARDWRRAQISTEIAFASLYYGAGDDWAVVSMIDDETSIRLLRQVQNKLITIVGRAEPVLPAL
jgi:hypothetical protein